MCKGANKNHQIHPDYKWLLCSTAIAVVHRQRMDGRSRHELICYLIEICTILALYVEGREGTFEGPGPQDPPVATGPEKPDILIAISDERTESRYRPLSCLLVTRQREVI